MASRWWRSTPRGFCRGKLDDTRSALDSAQESESVDPGVLELLRLLAIHDADAEKERLYEERLERRKQEMLPEVVEIEIDCVERLAESAEAEGRHHIAARLRESAN